MARGLPNCGSERDCVTKGIALKHALRGVILDVDGTLIDSNDAHARAWEEALGEAGYVVPFARIRELIGMGGDQIMPIITGLEAEDTEAKRISSRRGAIFEERYLADVQAFPGARELVQRMHANKLRLVIATSAQAEELDGLLAPVDIGELIEEETTSSDAKSSKPAPDVVQAALDKLGLAAGEVLMLGDTPYDIEAASRAGVKTVGLRCGGHDDEKLSGAIAIYDDPADLLAHYDESPFGRGA